MALTTQTYAEQLGRMLAEAARDESVVEEIWVSTRADGVDLWLLSQVIDASKERALHGFIDVLYARFKRSDFYVYVLNPRYFRGDPRSALPPHAVQIPFRVG
ncbi:MAG: hypothetical protein U0893_09835 [Chloroflexota bacterium]